MSEEKAKDQEKSKAKAAEGVGKKADKAPKAEAKADKGQKADKAAKGGKGKPAREDKAEKESGKQIVDRPLDGYTPRMMSTYKKAIIPALMKRFNYKNTMQVPRLDRIVVNMGVGEAVEDQKHLEHATEDLQIITGQKPSIRRSKKSISNFKLRQGMPIGCMVTLRRWRMYEFLDRFISLAVPRVRDFRGLPDNAFDGRGNYSIGVKEQIIFPEINYDKVSKIRGMNITFVTTANTDEEAYELLAAFGMPFRKR
jgi:large subunit ribosomal protein L5